MNRWPPQGAATKSDSYTTSRDVTNPLSIRLALDTLNERAQPGQRRVAMMGALLELGEKTVSYHEQLGAFARQRADVVIGVGELARHFRPDHWFASSSQCADRLEEFIRAGDCLLVKGSSSIQMNLIVDRFRARSEAGTPQTSPG